MKGITRIVRSADRLYDMLIKRWLPARVHRGLRNTYRFVEAAVLVSRVRGIVTRILGPEYTRSRRSIEIDITYACNLNCYNCNRSCEQAPTGVHMNVEQIALFVSQSLTAHIRWQRIRLLGGEPTLHTQFFEILDVLRRYRDDHSPETVIEVSTNGHGDRVNAAIARIPPDIVINNTAKLTKRQPDFNSFNIAPRDLPVYRHADFRNGCWVTQECGIGLGPHGYYVCAVASGIDRIYGWNMGYRTIPELGDDMEAHLRQFCSHCGFFKRAPEGPLEGPVTSATWRDAYLRYREQRPVLARYGTTPRPGGI